MISVFQVMDFLLTEGVLIISYETEKVFLQGVAQEY